MHAPLTPPSTVQRDEKNRRALRPFSIAVVAAVLLMQAPYAHAQHSSAPAGPSGVKRTCRVALQMSAFDPKRTPQSFGARLMSGNA